MTYKSIHQSTPAYLCKLIKPYSPPRKLSSADSLLLQKDNPRTKIYGDRAFKNCAPAMWNETPKDIRLIKKLSSFKRAFKTHLFRQAYRDMT